MELYTRIFQVMNSQYRLDEAYLSCAAPVAAAAAAANATNGGGGPASPEMIGSALSIAVGATRAAAEALRTGAKKAAEVGQVKKRGYFLKKLSIERNFEFILSSVKKLFPPNEL